MKKHRIKIIVVLVFLVAISSFMYFDAFATLTSYESIVDTKVRTTGAKFVVKINGTNIVTTDGSIKDMDITSTVTGSSHVKDNKVAPGSSLTIPVNINVYGSEVAVKFTLDVVDSTIDSDKAMTLMSITNGATSIPLTRTGPKSYTGVITKAMLNNNTDYSYTLNFEFIDEEIELTESLLETTSEDLFVINFNAIQYMGETITPYTGG